MREGREDKERRIRVLLADEHELIRKGARTVLEIETDIEVVGDVGRAQHVLDAVARLQPDVLVLELVFSDEDGCTLARKARAIAPSVRLVFLSAHGGEVGVSEALRSGARAYVLKHRPASELGYAIRAAVRGQPHLSPPLTFVKLQATLWKFNGGAPDPLESLTKREREVLGLLTRGLGNAEIGQKLGIAARTAETHRTNLMRKLGVHSSRELMAYALRRGLAGLAESLNRLHG